MTTPEAERTPAAVGSLPGKALDGIGLRNRVQTHKSHSIGVAAWCNGSLASRLVWVTVLAVTPFADLPAGYR